jgi:hypothetical protein
VLPPGKARQRIAGCSMTVALFAIKNYMCLHVMDMAGEASHFDVTPPLFLYESENFLPTYVFLKRQKRVKRLEGIISYGVSTI